MNNLLILGPYDRYNYGDLLFPYMIVEEIGEYFDHISIYSTSASDLSEVGGMKTLAISELDYLDPAAKNTIIIAGGESLGADWGGLCYYVDPSFKAPYFFLRVAGKFLSQSNAFRLKNSFGRWWFKGRTYMPLCVGKFEFPNLHKLHYNSLGGTIIKNETLSELKKFKEALESVDHLAVRDKKTKRLLTDSGVKAHLYPDSAILMSKFFPKPLLRERCSAAILDFVDRHQERYLVFQINNKLVDKYMDTIIEELEAIYYATEMTICLCPIGIAIGHEDHLALSKISKRLKVPHQEFSKDIKIWETMYLIAESRVFLGTSLHGAITAMSYATPYVGLHIQKLNYYLETWGIDGINRSFTFDQMKDAVIGSLKIPLEKLNQNMAEQSSLAEKSLASMIP